MASFDIVVDCMTTLQQANLSYPPGEIIATAKIWTRLLQDVPDDALTRATDDLILTSKEFPKLSELRQAAHQVQVHNGQSAAASPWKPMADPVVIWELPAGYKRHTFPTYPARLAALCSKETLTDAEMSEAAGLAAKYQAGIVERTQ
jgi:hypothetical protein